MWGPAEAWHQGVARKEGEAFQGSREEESEGSGGVCGEETSRC